MTHYEACTRIAEAINAAIPTGSSLDLCKQPPMWTFKYGKKFCQIALIPCESSPSNNVEETWKAADGAFLVLRNHEQEPRIKPFLPRGLLYTEMVDEISSRIIQWLNLPEADFPHLW